MQKKIFTVECKKLEKANTISAVFSTADPDRHGDIVLQNWELDNYKANPVVLNSHKPFDATEVVGKATSIDVIDGKLQGEIEFAVDANPKAKVIYELYAGGFLKAFSVGFIPKEYGERNVISLCELLEISAVSVPANQMALAKAKGIDVDVLKSTSLQDPDEVAVDAPEKVLEETEDIAEQPLEDKEVTEVTSELTEENSGEEIQTKLLNAVKALREEQKGRALSYERKKAINKAIRELLEAKKN